MSGIPPHRSPRSGGPLLARGAGSVLVVALLAGCAADRAYPGLGFPFAGRYQAAPGAPVLLSNDLWWQRLDDPTLDRLVTLALDGSPTLGAAEERLAAARALLGTVGLAGSAGASLSATVNQDGDPAVLADMSLSRVFDPGGALRAERRSAAAGADIAAAELDAARLRILSAVVTGYLDLRYRQQIVGLRRQELEGRRATLAAARRLVEAQEATRIDTVRAEARVAEIESDLPTLQADAATALGALAVLAGRAPGDLPADLAAALAGGGQPRATLAPEVGIPADLLRNRPDLRLAERRYYAAFVGVDAARADLYPRLSLRGSLSVDALDHGAAALALGPTLQLPALPQGPTRAAIAAREAEARAAAEDWRGAVVAAIGEVEAALLDYQGASRAEEAAARALRLNSQALALTRELFDQASATINDVIDAEAAVAAAETRLATLAYRRASAFAALNIRLGAGHAGPESAQSS